ncbi:MAG TPA: hypothetical protein VJ695_11685 [Nitrososphaera sp.]|nr:hypothetical protein [Nitrososphaera sp.]
MTTSAEEEEENLKTEEEKKRKLFWQGVLAARRASLRSIKKRESI